MSAPDPAKLAFLIDGGEVETLWATPVGQDLYRLEQACHCEREAATPTQHRRAQRTGLLRVSY